MLQAFVTHRSEAEVQGPQAFRVREILQGLVVSEGPEEAQGFQGLQILQVAEIRAPHLSCPQIQGPKPRGPPDGGRGRPVQIRRPQDQGLESNEPGEFDHQRTVCDRDQEMQRHPFDGRETGRNLPRDPRSRREAQGEDLRRGIQDGLPNPTIADLLGIQVDHTSQVPTNPQQVQRVLPTPVQQIEADRRRTETDQAETCDGETLGSSSCLQEVSVRGDQGMTYRHIPHDLSTTEGGQRRQGSLRPEEARSGRPVDLDACVLVPRAARIDWILSAGRDDEDDGEEGDGQAGVAHGWTSGRNGTPTSSHGAPFPQVSGPGGTAPTSRC